MSLISKALKKTQEMRQGIKKPSEMNIVYLTDTPKSWLKTGTTAILAIGTVMAIILSMEALNLVINNSRSKQTQGVKLEKIIKVQGKIINNLNLRLKQEAQNDKTNYENLKEAIEDDKQEINYLENETRSLNQKIAAVSVSTTQTQGR